MATIAFIGLGNMGGPMAANLVKAGHVLRVFDVVTANAERLRATGATPAASVAEAVGGAEAIVTMLPAGSHVLCNVHSRHGISLQRLELLPSLFLHFRIRSV